MSTDQDGLLVQLSNQKKLFLSNDILLQEVQAPLPSLRVVLESGLDGSQWRRRVEKDDPALPLFESANRSGEYAAAVKLEVLCHLNEVYNALFSDDAATFEAAMRGHFGKKFKRGAILHRFADQSSSAPTIVLVKSATFANSLARDVEYHYIEHLSRDIAARTATRLTKTLPKEFHDRLSKASVLGGAKEVVTCTHIEYSGPGKTSILFYASCCVDDEQPQRKSGSDLDKPMSFVVGLAKSIAEIQSIVRRRRLGFQTFISSSSKATARTPKRCHGCEKSLNVLRGDHYCQLCGHRTCAACADTLDVEPKPGVLRSQRICKTCARLTDRCVFDDLDLDVLGSPVVAEMLPAPTYYQLQAAAQRSSGSRGGSGSRETSASDDHSSDQKTVEYLFSHDPAKQGMALDQLGVSRLIADHRKGQHADTATASTAVSVSYAVFDSTIRRRLSRPVRVSVADCAVAESSSRREYLLSFEEGLQIPEVPPALDNEQIRCDMIEQIGFLQPSFKNDAFNIVCEIAAKIMDCRTAYLSVVTKDMQYAIAHCNMQALLKLPRREAMCAYALTTDRPFVVRNAIHDVRFREFFCVARAGFRFFASFPVEAPPALGGGIVASLVVMDKEPKKCITNRQYARMKAMADIVSELISALPRQ